MNVNRASFSTKARTWLLLAGLTALFIGVGAAIGGAFLWFFVVFSILMNVAAYWASDKFAIRAARAKPVTEAEAPDLHRLIEELAQLYDVPKPRVYLIPSDQPNAFATGPQPRAQRRRGHAGPAPVPASRPGSRGARARVRPHQEPRHPRLLDRGHDRGRDLRDREHLLLHGDLRRRRQRQPARSDRRPGDDHHRAARRGLLQLGVSRQREYLADATAARVLGTGEPLAEALETLERGRQAVPMQVNPATSSLYIVNPLKQVGVANLFSTHPPLEERIARLREYDRNPVQPGAVPPSLPTDRTGTSRPRLPNLTFGGAVHACGEEPLVASTQDQLYADIDLELSWSERDLPERERTKHVHRLHPYLGKFIPQLVETLLGRYVAPGGRVLDPFAGSGTTLVQALESGLDATGVDVAAFNCLLMRVKTAPYNEFVLEKEIRDVLRPVRPRPVPGTGQWLHRPVVRAPGGARAARLPLAGRRVRARGRPAHRARARRPLGPPDDPLRPRLPREPQLEPYWCHKHKRECRPVERAEHFIRRYALDTLARIKQFARARERGREATVVHGDARELVLDGTFDAVVTSPPYPG